MGDLLVGRRARRDGAAALAAEAPALIAARRGRQLPGRRALLPALRGPATTRSFLRWDKSRTRAAARAASRRASVGEDEACAELASAAEARPRTQRRLVAPGRRGDPLRRRHRRAPPERAPARTR